jgi:hypothetical protein
VRLSKKPSPPSKERKRNNFSDFGLPDSFGKGPVAGWTLFIPTLRNRWEKDRLNPSNPSKSFAILRLTTSRTEKTEEREVGAGFSVFTVIDGKGTAA